MNIHINVHHHADPALIDVLRSVANIITEGVQIMSREFQSLREQVERIEGIEKSAIELIVGLADKIENLKTDPVELQALADAMRSKGQALADAITKYTPAAADQDPPVAQPPSDPVAEPANPADPPADPAPVDAAPVSEVEEQV